VPFETLTTEIENRENRVGLGNTRGKICPIWKEKDYIQNNFMVFNDLLLLCFWFSKKKKKKNSDVPILHSLTVQQCAYYYSSTMYDARMNSPHHPTQSDSTAVCLLQQYYDARMYSHHHPTQSV